METNQTTDTSKIQGFGQYFAECQTNEELTRAACCARDCYQDGKLTEIEYKVICGMGAERRKELAQ